MYILIPLAVTLCWECVGIKQVHAVPVEKNVINNDQLLVNEYATLKHILIFDLGYTNEFADMVEINLKRAIREEKERQKLLVHLLRQEAQISEEDDEEDATAGPTTIGPAPGDIVKGVAQIITGLGTFDVNTFWGSFVNFFPPAHRESAQAVVDASQGRRPVKWPTLPTTTTKITTTTKDEDEIDSDEITTTSPVAGTISSVASATVSPAPGVSSGASPASAGSNIAAIATEAPTRAPTNRYTVRPRTPSPNGVLKNSVTVFEELLKP